MISRAEVQQKIDAAVDGYGEKLSLPERLAYLKALLEVLDAPEVVKINVVARALYAHEARLTPYSGHR